ncbi:MAG: hypothetical protein JWO13_2588 [Acidobacteriales bacterium]|nr:hypothetical protein [Terriglobales bacterium]
MTFVVRENDDSAIPAWKFLSDPELFRWKQLLAMGRIHYTDAEKNEYERLKLKCMPQVSLA